MGCFQVRYDSRVVIYEHKLFIRLATGRKIKNKNYLSAVLRLVECPNFHSIRTLQVCCKANWEAQTMRTKQPKC